MLFNSFEFALGFLPVVLGAYFALGYQGKYIWACAWLALGSVFFYGYWAPQYVVLMLASISLNYSIGRWIQRSLRTADDALALKTLRLGIITNLVALGYFKYAGFFVANIEAAFGLGLPEVHVLLPIGISFFTFTQIAYLVDTYQRKVKETNPVHYLLFVTYFPHLIAGPILHHAEMMPQFREKATFRFQSDNLLSGLVVFLIGLFKKVVLADGIQPFVGPVFEAPIGQPLSIVEAWGGALAYTLQLYFDFSGYSDMAIGLSRMFNIELPLNFNSPYKARNISDFWRRWHMTLSRFLRDYLYVPLGGNRKGPLRRYTNLFATMLLGGLWHGAGWPFVIWGALHGLYLTCNHGWQAVAGRLRLPMRSPMLAAASVFVTFFFVVIAWVFFRAKDFDAAWRVLSAMFAGGTRALPFDSGLCDLLGQALPWVQRTSLPAFGGDRQVIWTAVLLLAIWGLPNTQEMMRMAGARLTVAGVWRRNLAWLGIGAVLFWVVLLLMINETRGVSEFIYFNF
jgi:D-alanyl-lipoteichoic acid acyltransferase DltB (MBOAT superfamily)